MNKLIKLNLPQFLLILNGPYCAGKSSVAQYLLDNYDGIFRAWRDRIKWMIAGYQAERDGKITAEMTMALIDVALSHGLSVVQDQAITLGWEGKYQLMAKKYETKLIEVNIEASYEVLEKRFAERVAAAKVGAKISMTDPEKMREQYFYYQKHKNNDNLTYFSDQKTPVEIAEEIIKCINN
ncbi:MAG: AAA family ATPase [Patescibacteria group bacterium]